MNPNQPSPYKLETLITESTTEHRLWNNNHHFASLINERGTFILRPHPYNDPNAWGSSLYLQPFTPASILTHTNINNIITNENNIIIHASGKVSDNKQGNGHWHTKTAITFNEKMNCVKGETQYNIKLEKSVNDLNICKIASNYLTNVPLLSGEIGNTGDMLYAAINGENFNFKWYPHLQPQHFPQKSLQKLEIQVTGNYNNIDTTRQGYASIKPVLKPSIHISIESDNHVSFGGFYDQTTSKQFWSDNIGITPIIKNCGKEVNLKLIFESYII